MRSYCAVRGCLAAIEPPAVMCPAHWDLVPRATRAEIADQYGQGRPFRAAVDRAAGEVWDAARRAGRLPGDRGV
jgi:hypothetical protein